MFLKQILEEHGINTSRMKADDMQKKHSVLQHFVWPKPLGAVDFGVIPSGGGEKFYF